MKKIYYFIAAALLSMTISSCGEDWLTVESHHQLRIDEYYSTRDRIYEGLVAAYDPLQWFDWGLGQYNPIPLVFEVMADDQYPGGNDVNDNRQYHLMFNYTAEPTTVCSSLWSIAYSGVNRANCVHMYMPGVKNISEEEKALFLAEATVLRAYYYNILWKLWGNIPYYEVNLDPPYICPQSKADQVYAAVIEDLEDALENGGLPMKAAAGKEGRVTYAAAAMLYAEMVMYQNDAERYQKALDCMEEIITSGSYALVSDLTDMWEPSGEWSSETIFDINYFSDGAYRSWNSPLTAGGTVLPRLMGINELSGSAKYQNGWGFGPMTKSAARLFEPGDLREPVTVYEPAVDEPEAQYTPRFQNTGYFNAKYLPRVDGNANQIADADLNFNNNIRIYRYAETLLNAAELIAVHGCQGKKSADEYLNEVRTRAGLGSVTASLETILHERHLELMGEGKRYWDLIRTGKASQVLVPANDLGDEKGDVHRVNSWTESKKYLPIPQTEMDAAQGTLVQNNY